MPSDRPPPKFQWTYGPRSDPGDDDFEELVPEPITPPGPPPKSRAGGPPSARLPPPRGSMADDAAEPLKRRHSVVLPVRAFPPNVVSDVMTRKLIAIAEDETLRNIEDGMQAYRVWFFPVVDERNRLIGMVTWDDVLLASSSSLSSERQARDELIHQAAKAKDVMQRDVLSVLPNDTIVEAAKLMLRKNLRCLPVTDNRHTLVGLLTREDFLQLALDFLNADALK